MAPRLDKHTRKRRRRDPASVYDAVAGRVGYEGVLVDLPPSKYRDTVSSTSKAVPPEEVLFRRKGAPVRYEEDDVYWAERHLQPDQQLPDSDLLKALHAYASDFYGSAIAESCDIDFKSLDETALLALGILIEELVRHATCDIEDLAFMQPVASASTADDSSATSDDT